MDPSIRSQRPKSGSIPLSAYLTDLLLAAMYHTWNTKSDHVVFRTSARISVPAHLPHLEHRIFDMRVRVVPSVGQSRLDLRYAFNED
jgi:hypothetical protein